MHLRRALTLSVAAVVLLTGPAFAGNHKPRTTTPATYDVSYPQCGKALPSPIDGGIVGVNGGLVYSGNPCLATEYTWATAQTTPYGVAFYANTGDPGPAYSSHWPTDQQLPQVCDGSDSEACSYDYGYNAAQDSFARAAAVTTTASTRTWWLDVETGNSWETLESAYGQTPTAQANDRASIAGAVAALHDAGVTTVGVYSTSYQWGQITGGSGTQFVDQPVWVAGVGSLSTAKSNCASTSFTGGRVTLAQYASNGYDADVHC